MNDLLIKGADDLMFFEGYGHYDNVQMTWVGYHVHMGKGFVDALEAPLQLKDPIENDSRIEDGVRMLVSRRKAKRAVTLRFNIHGATRGEFMDNKRKFETMLYKGVVDIVINDSAHYTKVNGQYTDGVYHLVYTGKSVTYEHSYNGTFGVWTAQFIEPNPANRAETANAHVAVIT